MEEVLAKLKQTYKLKAEFLGPDSARGEAQRGKLLGRTITWGKDGLTWTGDTKLVTEMLRDWDMGDSNGAHTPGANEDETDERLQPMSLQDSARYRSSAAKLNYASLDNPRIAFAAKEASRVMSAPDQRDEPKIKRLLRFLSQGTGRGLRI